MKKILLALFLSAAVTAAFAADKKIILLAGRASHGAGEHEHRAGLMLFQKCLEGFPGIKVEFYSLQATGWVEDERIFDDAAAVIVYADGGPGHPLLGGDRLQKLGALMARGVGLGLIHYATEPTIDKGQKEFLDWTGGAFEIKRSVNPIFVADFNPLPQHPVTRGVKPFSNIDEWYYNIRFRDGMRGVTPILTAIPPDSSLNRPTARIIGDHEGNPDVAAKVDARESQHMMWVTERPDGGRGFGFTGGHFHANWSNDDERKLMLNAIVWVAKAEVPANGVASKLSPDDIIANLDTKGGRGGALTTLDTGVIGAMTAELGKQITAVATARSALQAAIYAPQARDADIKAKTAALAEAELTLAAARAEVFARLQSSERKFTPEKVQALIQQVGRGGR